MKTMKKFLAMSLAFILTVTFLPMVGKEEARAEGISGYYRWYMDRNGNSVFEIEGSPIVSGLADYVKTGGNGRLYASDYLDESGVALNLQHHVMERLKCVISQAENQLQVHI